MAEFASKSDATFKSVVHFMGMVSDRLCDLLVRVSGYKSRGPSSILSATRFSEK
jgi:hypothetical protein